MGSLCASRRRGEASYVISQPPASFGKDEVPSLARDSSIRILQCEGPRAHEASYEGPSAKLHFAFGMKIPSEILDFRISRRCQACRQLKTGQVESTALAPPHLFRTLQSCDHRNSSSRVPFDRPVFVPQILKSDICTRAQEPDTRAHAGTRNEPAHNTRPTRGTWCCHAVPQLATPSS